MMFMTPMPPTSSAVSYTHLVGKTAVAEGLALKIHEGEVPELLKHKRLLALDLTGMVAGSKYRGAFEAVSYTHLDVSKRQRLRCSAARSRASGSSRASRSPRRM